MSDIERELREENTRLRKQNIELTLRGFALLSLLPPETTCREVQKARDELDASVAIFPLDRWRHVKTGGVYEILGWCIIEATNKPAILYRSAIPESGRSIWARPREEFFDGRFEKV